MSFSKCNVERCKFVRYVVSTGLRQKLCAVGGLMEKDTRLINIYLKIHHKRSLTISDLSYLAQYDPECFKKTCKNVVYNIPETKPIMSADTPEFMQAGGENPNPASSRKDGRKLSSPSFQADEAAEAGSLQQNEMNPGLKVEPESSDWQDIEKVLENLKHLEMQDVPVADIDADRVKDLLGNLYMELLFPHNDNYPFMDMMDHVNEPSFDKRA